jgi:hypothetical protein
MAKPRKPMAVSLEELRERMEAITREFSEN